MCSPHAQADAASCRSTTCRKRAARGEPGAIASDAGTGIRFDGASGALVLGDVLDFSGAVPFSVEVWAKVQTRPATGIEWLFSKEVGVSNIRDGYSTLVTTDLQIGAEIWIADDARVAYSSSPVTRDAWTHIVVTSQPGALLDRRPPRRREVTGVSSRFAPGRRSPRRRAGRHRRC